MSNNSELVRILASNFNFDLSKLSMDVDSESAFLKELQMKLAERIKFFIRTDLDKLLQALYRIDINDKESDKAFNLGEINEVSSKLAELIIVRQLQKIEYSNNFNKNR